MGAAETIRISVLALRLADGRYKKRALSSWGSQSYRHTDLFCQPPSEMFQALSGAGCRLLSLLGIPSRVDNDDDDPSIGRQRPW